VCDCTLVPKGLFSIGAVIGSGGRAHLTAIESANSNRASAEFDGGSAMSTNFSIASLSRAAAVSLSLVIPALAGLSTAAHADDEYGTNRGPSILQSAQSVFAADKSQTPLAVATAQAHVATSPIATTADRPPVTGLHDLVGQGGQQDAFARGAFHPGSGTDW
jgi:hypothetical protein